MSDEQQSASELAQAEESVPTFAQFLESVSPGQRRKITTHIVVLPTGTGGGQQHRFRVRLPEIQLHCPYETCNGERFFRPDDDDDDDASIVIRGSWKFEYLTYKCSNCQKEAKTFSVAIRIITTNENQFAAECFKFGELPPYGPQTPSRLISLLGTGRELFLKGRRCESQGLGIGAFVYYRRVVEDQKNRILAEIIKVAQMISAPKETIAALEAAQSENQFSRAIESVKNAIPQRLLIAGQNPLTLLHRALSKGLHNHSDETCLELASDIRLILVELAELLEPIQEVTIHVE
jgi:hypothetical protein